MLEVSHLAVSYGGALAVDDVTISIERGEAISIIGPNGAGKTSLLRAISGLVPYAGEISFDGRSLVGMPPHRIVAAGVVHCPEAGQLFGEMTVEENLRLGAFTVRDGGRVRRSLEQVFALFPRLAERRRQEAGTLSGGERQMLAIGRSLMAQPDLLMLDEPSLGLAPFVRDRIEECIREVHRDWRLTIILVEQDTAFALDVAERVYVLDGGRIVIEGPVAAVSQDPAVRATYLGVA